MAKNVSRYPYRINASILYNQTDDYSLSESEFYRLYSFFVTYSCCGNQSMKKRCFADYGWYSFARSICSKDEPNRDVYLKDRLSEIIDLEDKANFVFISDSDDIAICFQNCNLADGPLADKLVERAVIGKTSEPSKFLKLFYRIRDGLAHGKFILKYNENNEKMVIIQDDDGHFVTARLIIKLSTLLEIISAVDKNQLISVA